MPVLAAHSAQVQHQPRVAAIICMEERYTNIAFFRLQKGKGSCAHPQHSREGSEIHFAPTFRGCLLIFLGAALLSALDGLVWEAVAGCDFTKQTPARPHSTSSQEVFSTSSTPTFASQHTIAGLVLSITLVLLDGPSVSEQNTTAPSPPATRNPADPNTAPSRRLHGQHALK